MAVKLLPFFIFGRCCPVLECCLDKQHIQRPLRAPQTLATPLQRIFQKNKSISKHQLCPLTQSSLIIIIIIIISSSSSSSTPSVVAAAATLHPYLETMMKTTPTITIIRGERGRRQNQRQQQFHSVCSCGNLLDVERRLWWTYVRVSALEAETVARLLVDGRADREKVISIFKGS